ncbi:MAG: N-6 DNA methylase [Enterococcus sp.]|nr:N-6 DNA methylase [Enterococcus sp.]
MIANKDDMTDKKQQRGQFFTTSQKVQQVMVDLLENTGGKFLEPSAGAGHLVKALEDKFPNASIDAVELDENIVAVCDTPIQNNDFFVFADSAEASYDVIFGNPPYVSWKAMEESSKISSAEVKKGYSEKTNLYHLFIDRCIDLLADHGEMVLIVPKEWLYSSSAGPLRKKIYESGHLSHIVDCGEEKLFADADVPALLIFRFVKSERTSDTRVNYAENLSAALENKWEERELVDKNSRWLLLHKELAHKVSKWGRLGDVMSVKVGIVSGLDGVFRVSGDGSQFEAETVVSYITTKGIEKFIDVNHIDKWEDVPPKTAAYLLSHKDRLISRKIAKFSEANWWKYGAIRNKTAMESDLGRVYVFGRTRSQAPFFANTTGEVYYSGGILGLFARDENFDPTEYIDTLNSAEFREVLEAMFLATGTKISLQPATLEDAPFPVS